MNNFTQAQIDWASQHDWFIEVNSTGIKIKTDYVKNGELIEEEATVSDFYTLKNMTY